MSKNGLLIDYEYCTGCFSCVVACKQEHGYPAGKGGILVNEVVTESSDQVRVDFIPFPTDLCDLCVKRVSQGESPACVKHCQSQCMMFGPLDELVINMENLKRSVLFAPRASAYAPSSQ